jgi:glycosyltransferase involved in cell wall biosynthesis
MADAIQPHGLCPKISVVVPFHNGAKHIGTLLESLVAQRVTDDWEVVMVDNRSSDASRHIVDGFMPRLPLRIVDAPARANIGYARNVGVRASSGPRLLFVDADDELEGEYISTMAAALAHHAFVTSRVDSTALNPSWVQAAHGPYWQATEIGIFYDFLPAAGSNIAIRRPLYDQLGGFSEDCIGCEDIAFSWNAALTAGVIPVFVPDAVYRYRYRDSLHQLFRQAALWGHASTVLYRQFRSCGMPPRPIRLSVREWREAVTALSFAFDRASRARSMVRLGYCLGRLRGSLRHRVMFL